MLRTTGDTWNIGREIIHLLWAYGQKGHSLKKSDLDKWDGGKMYQSFFRLDEDAKGFQVIFNFCCTSYNHHFRLISTLPHYTC